MERKPRCVFGVPTYNHVQHVERSLRSLLDQSFSDFTVVVCDDASSDGTQEVLQLIANEDSRLLLHFNEKRIGYTSNARQTFALAGSFFPDAEFFAWGSDHDLWHPDWLDCMVKALEGEPDAVVAWPWFHRIDENGCVVSSRKLPLGHGESRNPLARIRFAAYGLHAGSCFYGLYRRWPLERIDSLKYVVDPDRLLLAQLSLLGPFAQVPAYLWSRRYQGLASRTRQRRSFFPYGAPWYAYMPRSLQHCWILLRDVVIQGRMRPEVSRTKGGVAIFFYVVQSRLKLFRRMSSNVWHLPRNYVRHPLKPSYVRHPLKPSYVRRLLKPLHRFFHRRKRRVRKLMLAVLRRLRLF